MAPPGTAHRRRPAKPRRAAWILGASCIGLAGCAYSYVDDHGTRHVVGLVDLELPASEEDQTFAGHVVDLTTLGISFSGNPSGSSFTVGYSREVTGYLRNHALVLGDSLAVRAAGARHGAEP